MMEPTDFTEKAREAADLAASARNSMIRDILERVAREYRLLAEQETKPPVSTF